MKITELTKHIHCNLNLKANLNEDGIPKTLCGISSVACIGVTMWGVYKKDMDIVYPCVAGCLVCGGCYLYLRNKDNKSQEKAWSHEMNMSKIIHAKKESKSVENFELRKVDAVTPAVGTHTGDLDFHSAFHLGHFTSELPPMLDVLVSSFPVKFQDSALLHLICMFGALAFSNVRSVYLDNELHGPWLQVMISGPSASGKSMFRSIYEKVFSRVISSDKDKLGRISQTTYYPPMIVQNIGAGITSSMLLEILAGNKGIQAFIFESEVLTLTNEMSKSNSGFSYDLFRKSFDGSTFFQGRNKKGTFSGHAPAAFNLVCTGVDEDMKKFIDLDKKAGGNANRIAWCEIPDKDQATPGILDLPSDSEMEQIKDSIDAWREQFCYKTEEGDDVPVEMYTIDLFYLHAPLNDWLHKQFEYGMRVGSSERKNNNTRMAAIAFHAGLVLHMMFGEPTDVETRQKVVDLTLYIANYVMEGYIHRFASRDAMYFPGQNEPSSLECNTLSKSLDMMTEEELKKEWSRTGDYQYALLLNTKFLDSNGQSRYGGGTLNKLYPVYSVRSIQDKLSKLRNASQI